jgi:hypothetical protein
LGVYISAESVVILLELFRNSRLGDVMNFPGWVYDLRRLFLMINTEKLSILEKEDLPDE